MNQHNSHLSPSQLLVLFCGIVLVFLFSMHYRLGPEVADDGAFFLRYAENMLKGDFWVWNPGEAPVWGASAPLYPLIIAIPMALGLSPESAIIVAGLALSSVSLAAVTLMLGQRFGVVAGFAFLVFGALDSGLMYFSGAGLETPLTISLLALGLWTLLYQPRAWVIGVVAGLLMVNKIDLIPVGGLLLLAHWLQDKRFPKVAFMVAGLVALAWYGFAWLYFGAPVPNSFLTKALHQNNMPKSIDWTWFGAFVLWLGIHKWLVVFSVPALWRGVRSFAPLLVFFAGLLAVHLVAYTIKYPFEPYNWYAMPAVFSLLVLGAIGVGLLADLGARPIRGKKWITGVIGAVLVGGVFVAYIRQEILGTQIMKSFSSHQEYDRTEAGKWVNKNTPKNFVVYTMWGNPAYYSQREVLDGSFLNRKYENDDNLIKKYRPEILILQNQSGDTPMDPVYATEKNEGYSVVKVFDKTYLAGMDYFFAVLARNDVIDKIKNIDPPRDLMPYISDVHLGDKFGILRPQGVATLFVHPGATTVTSFEFAAADYVRGNEGHMIKVYARISPEIPAAAVKRGGGNVRVHILQGDQKLEERVVKVGEPFECDLHITNNQPLKFIVDNNGNPDTDWLWLSIH